MILNIMHHVQDCNRVLEVRRGLVVSTVLFPPTSLKNRVIQTLELCSCGKEKKNTQFILVFDETPPPHCYTKFCEDAPQKTGTYTYIMSM